MRLSLILACTALSLGAASAAPAVALADIELPRFDTIKVSNGAHVIIRHGPQKLRLVRGSWERSGKPGRTLEIDACKPSCEEGRHLMMEVISPGISEIHVSHGGKVEMRGNFPNQRKLDIRVDKSGVVDSRPVPVEVVTAAVHGQGLILTRADEILSVTLGPGGAVRYWGKPSVVNTESKGPGGSVSRGDVR